MSDPKPTLVGIVIKSDGRVPFDEGVHPEVRKHILAHLRDKGHELEHPPGCDHHKGHGCSCSAPVIKGWKP